VSEVLQQKLTLAASESA